MIAIQPMTPTFVAEISGVDVRSITDAEFEQLYAAWLEFGVLRLRDQPLNEDELQAFSARFGPLEEIPMGRLSESARAKIKNRYVTQLSNIIVDGKPIGGLGNAEANWHSDMTYNTHPPKLTMLYALQAPEFGGETAFANQVLALEEISPGLRSVLGGLRAVHSGEGLARLYGADPSESS